MRLVFSRTRARILVCLGAFLLALLSSLLLGTTPSPAQSQAITSSPPVEITQGWEYRWGDSPVDEGGIPLWTKENSSSSEWKPLKFGENLKKPSQEINIAWLRVRLPEGQWQAPTLYQKYPNIYQKSSYLLEIYLESQLITKVASLDSSDYFKPENNALDFIPLMSDASNKTLFFKIYADKPDSVIKQAKKILLGSHKDLVQDFLQKNINTIVNLTLGGFYTLIGIVTILLGARSLNKPTYLFFGLLAVSTGLSTFANSGNVDFVIDQVQWSFLRVGDKTGLLSLLLIPGFVCAFFEQVFGSGYKAIIRRMSQVYLVFTPVFFVLSALCITGNGNKLIWDLFRLLFSGHFLMLLATIVVILSHSFFFIYKGEIESRIFSIGFIILTCCFSIDIFSFTFKKYFSDLNFLEHNFFYLGMLVFIILLGWIVQHRFIEASNRLQSYATELEAKNAALQQGNKLKDEFLANTSHELRTPLNGIIGIAESLIDGATGTLPKETVFNLSLIVSSGRRLTQLVNDLLDFSKLKHKNISLQIKPIGIREITDVVLMLSQPLIGQKSLKLVNSISSDIPLIDADENRVQQILHNLICNAIKFSEIGVVEVSAAVVKNYLKITISDAGIGIQADKLDRIFEAFEQADGSIGREYGGTGLGLAVTKQLVQLHGGEIWVVSQPGKGSQFTFTLPLSQSTSVETPSTVSKLLEMNRDREKLVEADISLMINDEPSVDSEALTPKAGGFHILMVDDEPINLQVLTNHLSLQNYQLTQASDGKEALALIEKGFKPDIVLLDVMMPRMTGYEVCKKIREHFPATELPVVLLTAQNQVSDLVEGFSSGANDYLTKPISKNELLARIKTHIQLSKINIAYSRFVPREFLEFLKRESIVDVQLGDQVQQEMTILFSDIRSFTTLSENMSPKENFDFLNDYLKRVGPVIRNHKGFIDKYIGDAVMALFPQTPDDALQAAIAMQQQVLLFNLERQAEDYPSLAIGVGLHTGSLMLGTIGEEQRMESTVIADAVNLASRLEGLTKIYGVGILISEQTLSQLNNPEQYSHRYLGQVLVKGKKAPVAVFEVYEGESDTVKTLKTQTRREFERGVELYELEKFEQAQAVFESILEQNEQDKPARLYVERSQNAQSARKDGSWEEAETHQENR
ncbi:MAG: response regulator [Symplocastrum torsivum CPER-KK1]|jgi:two-component system sensor histidine kinase ChiS|uniref:Circadian input-output histidine kinase CikA n=1 Tax=Symplocastrum torsivum CPER-KK1 TaxID=450513 RepID=A0A951PRU5_9CYAN|nr:response regulator [Symplocastrum torsivum CPER-KK1]